MLLMCDEMESNETLMVKGVEQFCYCRGCGASIEFVEECTDQSKVSKCGDCTDILQHCVPSCVMHEYGDLEVCSMRTLN